MKVAGPEYGKVDDLGLQSLRAEIATAVVARAWLVVWWVGGGRWVEEWRGAGGQAGLGGLIHGRRRPSHGGRSPLGGKLGV